MNKNRFAVIMVIVLIVVGLIGGWFYLQHVMDKYDVDEKDWNETDSSLDDSQSANNDTIFMVMCEHDTFSQNL